MAAGTLLVYAQAAPSLALATRHAAGSLGTLDAGARNWSRNCCERWPTLMPAARAQLARQLLARHGASRGRSRAASMSRACARGSRTSRTRAEARRRERRRPPPGARGRAAAARGAVAAGRGAHPAPGARAHRRCRRRTRDWRTTTACWHTTWRAPARCCRDSRTREYLERAYARAHCDACITAPGALGSALRELFRDDIPAAIAGSGPTSCGATVIFVLAALAGYALVHRYPGAHRAVRLAGSDRQRRARPALDRGAAERRALLGPVACRSSPTTSSSACSPTAPGFLFGLGTLYILGLNGLMLGAVFAFVERRTGWATSCSASSWRTAVWSCRSCACRARPERRSVKR